MTTSGAVMVKAGKYVSSDITDTMINQFINEAEAYINTETRKDWTALYPTLSGAAILSDIASSLAAIPCINYDMSGFNGGRAEGESRMQVLRDAAMRGIAILKDDKSRTYLEGT